MRLFQHSIVITQPPDAVFDYFVDFSQAAAWRQYVRTMVPKGAGPVRAGSLIHVTLDLMGEPYTFDMEVLLCDRPSRWRHRTDETDFNGYVEYRFDPDPAGTHVTMTVEAKPRNLYGWLGLPLMLLRREKPYSEQLPQLKRALEAQ